MFNNEVFKYCNIKFIFSLLFIIGIFIFLFFLFKYKYNDNKEKHNSTYKYLMYIFASLTIICIILLGIYAMKNLFNKDCRRAQYKWKKGEI